jgi:hypothetical protein
VPDRPIDAGELAALLGIETLPVTLPVLAGVNVTFNVVLCPGDKIVPDAPLALKPAPEMLTLEMVTLVVPEFLTEIDCEGN